MAYYGVIDYISVPFGSVEWNRDLQSPFTETRSGGSVQWHTGDVDYTAVSASARTYSTKRSDMCLVFDEPRRKHLPGIIRCVIVGTRKQQSHADLKGRQESYVLLVVPINFEGTERHERVGVGTLEKEEIDFMSPPLKILIM